MREIVFSFIFLVFFALSISGQTKEAKKIDEFGKINCDDLTARLDNFFLQVKGMQKSKGYIIVYEGKIETDFQSGKMFNPRRGEAKAYIKTIKTRIKFSQFDEQRIVFVEGGLRENFTVELWLAPDESKPPKPMPTLQKIIYRKGKPPFGCGDF